MFLVPAAMRPADFGTMFSHGAGVLRGRDVGANVLRGGDPELKKIKIESVDPFWWGLRAYM